MELNGALPDYQNEHSVFQYNYLKNICTYVR